MDCFISYHSSDLKKAEQLWTALVDVGFSEDRIWFDKRRLKSGSGWAEELGRACDTSRVVLALLTPRWAESEWTRFECYGAERVIPIVAEGDVESVVPTALRKYQAESLSPAFTESRGDWARRLVARIEELLAEPVLDRSKRELGVQYFSNPHFVGRARELLILHETLERKPEPRASQGIVCVIVGLSGMGKTSMVRQYVEYYWRCYHTIVWLNGTSRDVLMAELGALYGGEDALKLTELEKARRVLSRFERLDTPSLIIVDGVPEQQTVADLLPKWGSCRVLITSHASNWPVGVVTCLIGALPPEAARELFLKCAQVEGSVFEEDAEQHSALNALLAELQGLPLALEQAGAYVRKQRFSVLEYWSLYQRATKNLLSKGALGISHYPDSVATTWSTSVKQVTEPARALLKLCSLMAPLEFPVELFVRGASFVQQWCGAKDEDEFEDDEFFVREAISSLQEYSLVRVERGAFLLHPLVQTVERLNMTPQLRCESLHVALLIARCLPEEPDDPQHWLFLRSALAHLLMACTRSSDERLDMRPWRATWELEFEVAIYAARFHLGRNELSFARSCLEFSSAVLKIIGHNPSRTGQQVSCRANLEEQSDNWREAEQLRREHLALCEEHVGADEPTLSGPLEFLAKNLLMQGKAQQARPLLERAVELASREPGDENLAGALLRLEETYNLLGRTAESKAVRQRILHCVEARISPNGSHLAQGEALLERQDLEAAQSSFSQFLQQVEREFGTHNDRLANAHESVAIAYDARGLHRKALEHRRRAVDLSEAALGKQHPMHIEALRELAASFEKVGNLVESERVLTETLQIQSSEQHSDMVETINALVAARLGLGQLDGLDLLTAQAIAILKRSSGHRHQGLIDLYLRQAHIFALQGHLAASQCRLLRAMVVAARFRENSPEALADWYLDWAENLPNDMRQLALPLAQRSVELLDESRDEPSELLARGLGLLLNNLPAGGSEHHRVLARLEYVSEQLYGINDPQTISCRALQAGYWMREDDLERVESGLKGAIEVLGKSPDPDHQEMVTPVVDILCEASLRRGRPVQAAQSLLEALHLLLRRTRADQPLDDDIVAMCLFFLHCCELAPSLKGHGRQLLGNAFRTASVDPSRLSELPPLETIDFPNY